MPAQRIFMGMADAPDGAVEKAILTKWLKDEGEEVARGEPIAKVMLTFDAGSRGVASALDTVVPANATGTLTRRLANEGERVPLGGPIGYIQGEGEPDFDPELETADVEPRPTAVEGTESGGSERSRLKANITRLINEADQKGIPYKAIADRIGTSGQQENTKDSATATRRLNVVFSETAYDELKELADQSGKTISDVVRDAIALQKWFNDVQSGGGRVLVEQRGRVREIINVR